METVSFYIDENLSPKIAEQLRMRGIDAVSVRDLDALGDCVFSQKDAAGNWEWLLQDGLGSVRSVVNNSGAVLEHRHFDPYGNLVGGAISQSEYGFTGEPFDTTNGLLYLRARHYRPANGTFASRDPYAGTMARPMSRNGYSWVEGRVADGRDPSGLQTTTCQWPEPCSLYPGRLPFSQGNPAIEFDETIPSTQLPLVESDLGDYSGDALWQRCSVLNGGACLLDIIVLSDTSFGILSTREPLRRMPRHRNSVTIDCNSTCPATTFVECRIDYLPPSGVGDSRHTTNIESDHFCPPNTIAQMHHYYNVWWGPYIDDNNQCHCISKQTPEDPPICIDNWAELLIWRMVCMGATRFRENFGTRQRPSIWPRPPV